MMLSKRITAKSLELKPASQARNRMVKESRDCQPAGCDKPPDSPPPGERAATVLLLLAEEPDPERPELRAGEEAPELTVAALCLLSRAACSAMLDSPPLAAPPPPPPPGVGVCWGREGAVDCR